MLPSLEASKKEDVDPSALPTIFSVENEEPELAELRALIKLSPLSLLSTQPTTILLLSDVTAITLTEFDELNVSGDPKESPLFDDLAKTAL